MTLPGRTGSSPRRPQASVVGSKGVEAVARPGPLSLAQAGSLQSLGMQVTIRFTFLELLVDPALHLRNRKPQRSPDLDCPQPALPSLSPERRLRKLGQRDGFVLAQ